MLLVNLRMDAVFIKENMRIRWVAESGIVENIQQVVKEYKQSRGLEVIIFSQILPVKPVFQNILVLIFRHQPFK